MRYLLLLLFSFLFHNSFAQSAPGFDWADHYGSPDNDRPEKVRVDNNGNVYTLVRHEEGFTSHGQTFPDPNYDGHFLISKHDRKGTFLFAKPVHATHLIEATSIAVDRQENVYVCGYFKDTLKVGGLQLFSINEDQQGFIAKLDKQGNTVWIKMTGTFNNDFIDDIAVDTADNIVVSGRYSGYSRTFDGITVTSMNASGNLMLGKLDPAGTFQWVKHTYHGYTFNTKIAIDKNNNILLAGRRQGGLSFDGVTYPLQSNNFLFSAKFTGNGTFEWATTPVSNTYITFMDMTADEEGNTYITGQFEGTLEFSNTHSVTSSMGASYYLVKYNAAGSVQRVKRFETYSGINDLSLTTDQNNNLYLAGAKWGPWLDGADTVAGAPDGYRHVVIQFNDTGAINWQAYTNVHTSDWVEIATDKANNVFLAGAFFTNPGYPFPVGDSLFTSNAGSSDMFLVRLGGQQLVTIGEQDKVSYCKGDSIIVPFTNIDTAFAGGNTFELQLSDANGSFNYPVMLATISTPNPADTFMAQLPTGIATGTAYRLRIVSSEPKFISWSFDTGFAIQPLPATPVVTETMGTLACNVSGLFYQWYRDNILLPGATSQQYTPAQTGNYTVIVTNSNGCSNTSAAYTFFPTDVATVDVANDIHVYPNPVTNGMIYMQTQQNIKSIVLYDLTGKVMQQYAPVAAGSTTGLELPPSAKGIYMIKISMADDRQLIKKITVAF